MLAACSGHQGRHLWVIYVAEWCPASRQQRPWAAQAFRNFPDGTDVAVVLTGGDVVFEPATLDLARAWSAAMGLAQTRVAVAEEGVRTVPQHLLLGPDGRTLWRYNGVLEAGTMIALLEDFRSGRRLPAVR